MKTAVTWCAAILVLGVHVTAMPATAQPCTSEYNNFNGPKSFYLNLQNCGTPCGTRYLPYLEIFKDGISGIRLAPVVKDRTSPGDPEFFEVNDFDPLFAGVLETFGPDRVIAVIDDNVDRGEFRKPRPNDMARKLSSLIHTHPQVRHIEFMNEPAHFSGIIPEEYVGRYLTRAREIVDMYNADRAPDNQILLYSAAWFGNRDGVRAARRMIQAGGLALVDAMSVHIYSDRAADAVALAREYKRMARGKPIALTETNFNDGRQSRYDTQEWWICESMTAMERVFRKGLSAEAQQLQANVYYTLRADAGRLFNLIQFPDATKALFWENTGPGQSVISGRATVGTDPKDGGGGTPTGDEDGGDDGGGGGVGGQPPIGPPGGH